MNNEPKAPALDMEQAVREVYPGACVRFRTCPTNGAAVRDGDAFDAPFLSGWFSSIADVWADAYSKLPQSPESVLGTKAPKKWLVPADESPRWLLMWEDPECGPAMYASEREAREAFAAASVSFNCWLFAPMAVAPVESVLDVQGGGFEEWWKREGPEWSDARLIEPYAKSAWHAALATLAASPAQPEVGLRWDRIAISDRQDIVGVRILEGGQRQFLMHNEALCAPYYTAVEGVATLAASPTTEEIFAMKLPPECSAWWRAAGQWHKELQEAQEEIARLKAAVAPANPICGLWGCINSTGHGGPHQNERGTQFSSGDPAAVSGEAIKCTCPESMWTGSEVNDSTCQYPHDELPANPSPLAAFEQVERTIIRWNGTQGRYCVNRPNYEGGQVVPASDFDTVFAYAKGLQEQIDRLKGGE